MTPAPLEHALLLARTVRHLNPSQLAHRARLRVQGAVLARTGPVLASRRNGQAPAHRGWPSGFAPIDARVATGHPGPEANAAGRFSFLYDERQVLPGPDWEQARADRLWRFQLHGFEWAWSFAAHPDRGWASSELRRLWRSWRESTRFGHGDAWSPYVASLRAWALCGVHGPLLAGTDDEDDFVHDLALHASFLRAHLELDVGGNHLVKNLKALIGLGVFLGDDRAAAVAERSLARQTARQVLPDGGHFERSPSYHCQVLGDLMDVHDLLATVARTPPSVLADAIASMRSWLGVMLLPDGEVPLLNDCTPVGEARLALLAPTPPSPARLTVLQPSGYAVVRTARLHLVADVGPPCPPELPAHAHADCLSFELTVDGSRLVTDTGTSTYRTGPRRRYERSTAAHSTVEIDGADQTEVWGAFRAARRAQPLLEHVEAGGPTVTLTASHDGYERLPGRPRHRRTWRLSDEGMEISDEVRGQGTHEAVARLILAPGIPVEPLGPGSFRAGDAEIDLAGGAVALRPIEVARGFGRLQPAHSLELSSTGPLPWRSLTKVACRRPAAGSPVAPS